MMRSFGPFSLSLSFRPHLLTPFLWTAPDTHTSDHRAEKRGFDVDSEDDEEDGAANAAHHSKMNNALH